MAHLRNRQITASLEKALKWSPTVSLVGMRQTGKTTLLKQTSSTYMTLDDDLLLGSFERSEWLTLEQAQAPVAVDECQKLPKIFDRIKLYVDQRRIMGRFILSGSVRFLSKKQIKESLTGRTAILELLPFLVSEAHEKPLGNELFSIFRIDPTRATAACDSWFRAFEKRHWLTEKHLTEHLSRGGLPGIGFRRDVQVRSQLFRVQLDTLLGRDIFYLTQTKLTTEKLRNLYRELCLIQGLPVNESELARKIGVTPPTIRKMIDVFSGLFLLRRHGKTLYCEDGGLAEYAIGGPLLSERQRLKAFVYRELLGRCFYQYPGEAALSSYEARGGAEVPFVWSFQRGELLGLTVDAESVPGEKSIRSLESFLKAKAKNPGPVRAIALHRGQGRFIARKGIVCLPITDLG